MASTSSSNNNINHESFDSCFDSWMTQQRNDLEELANALGTSADDKMLNQLTQKNIKHLEEYHDTRALLAQHDAPSFLSPPWCTSLENSFLWIGGYRPSLFIQLVYSVSGSELEAQLQNLYRGERKGNLGEISPCQLTLINCLHCKAVTEEDKLSTKMATLQACN